MQESRSYLFRDVNNSDWVTPLLSESGNIPVDIKAGGGGTQFAEDATHVSGDVGNVALGVRTDTPINRSGADGDYEPFQVTGGRMHTIPGGVGATSLGKAEDAIHTTGDTGVPAWGVANEANAAFAVDGDYVPIGTDTEGNVRQVGNRDHDAVDAGEPVKIGGVARTANPTAVGALDRVNATFDKLGRQVTWPYQVRDLITSARAVLTTGTEATVSGAVVGVFQDLMLITCANESDVAVTVDVRAVLAGNIEFSIRVPANGTAGFAPPIPWPQAATGNAWTADMSDITGTTVNIAALFINNV